MESHHHLCYDATLVKGTVFARYCSEMGRLRGCQGSLLKRLCGNSAATVLNELFDIALRDPHYLRFGYRPDCRLHGADAAPSASQPPDAPPRRPPLVSHASIPPAEVASTARPVSSDLHQPHSSRRAAGGQQRASSRLVCAALLLLIAGARRR